MNFDFSEEEQAVQELARADPRPTQRASIACARSSATTKRGRDSTASSGTQLAEVEPDRPPHRRRPRWPGLRLSSPSACCFEHAGRQSRADPAPRVGRLHSASDPARFGTRAARRRSCYAKRRVRRDDPHRRPSSRSAIPRSRAKRARVPRRGGRRQLSRSRGRRSASPTPTRQSEDPGERPRDDAGTRPLPRRRRPPRAFRSSARRRPHTNVSSVMTLDGVSGGSRR